MFREVRVALVPVPRPDAWLFLIGCYNSGTTLVARLLSTHPEISALPTEGQFLTDQLVKDHRIGLPRMWHKHEDLFRMTEGDEGPDVRRIKKEWALRLDRSRPVLVEKSPPNTARTRWLQSNFENAHFVYLMRNGYAVAEGIRRKGRPHHRPEGWSIAEAAGQWRRSIEVVLEDAPHLDRLLWVRYEDLTADPTTVLTEITSFVGLRPYEESHLPESISVHERDQGVVDLNAESIRRLSREDINVFNGIASPLMEQYGYRVL